MFRAGVWRVEWWIVESGQRSVESGVWRVERKVERKVVECGNCRVQNGA